MHPMLIILHLMAAVMLLLWSVRLVQKGVDRCFGPQVRSFLRAPMGGRFGLAASGFGLAIVMQSATAVTMLAAGFTAAGLMMPAMGLAAVLGADLGSALVVALLSFDLSEAIPVLLLVGAGLQVKTRRKQMADLGLIFLGCALLLLSLRMMGEATQPLRVSGMLPGMLRVLAGDPLTAALVAGTLAWALHSTAALLLVLAGLAEAGVLPDAVVLPMVIGTNLGGALVGVWLTRSLPPAARRIPLANALLRGGLGLVAVLAAPWLAAHAPFQGGAAVVATHLGFNAALLVAFLPLIHPADRLAALILPDPKPSPEARPDLLRRDLLDRPAMAIGAAQRELLAMGDLVVRMLMPVMQILDGKAPDQIAQIHATEEAVNDRHTAIKLYLAEVARHGSGETTARALEIVDFSISLEHAADLVVKTLLTLADERRRGNLRFSDQGHAEIDQLHGRVTANLQLALNVVALGDLDSARSLAREKEIIRQMEQQSRAAHLARLRAANLHSIDTSDLHLEILRALKEINSLVVSVAYPILSRSGALRTSRLIEEKSKQNLSINLN